MTPTQLLGIVLIAPMYTAFMYWCFDAGNIREMPKKSWLVYLLLAIIGLALLIGGK